MVIRLGNTVDVVAFATRRNGAVFKCIARIPEDLWLRIDTVRKDSGEDDAPKTQQSPKAPRTSEGGESGVRWITVHPHGDEERGIPVKIRESKTSPGTWHVIGGAGGNLNYLKLTNVKSPEEYKKAAKEKQAEREKQQQARSDADDKRRSALTPEERQAEDDRAADDASKRQQAEVHLELQKREFVANIAKLAGWDDSEWKFESTAARLKEAGATDKRIESLERQHLKRVYAKAERVVRETKKQLLLDHEARAEAGLADLPLRSDDPDTIALADLDPDKPRRGVGYKRDVTRMSDGEILGVLASADVAHLEQQLQEAQDDYNSFGPAGEGKRSRIAAELDVAQTLRDKGTKTPEELKKDAADLEEQLRDAQAAFSADDLKKFRKLEQKERRLEAKGDGLDGDQQQELHEVAARLGHAMENVANIKHELDKVNVLLGSADPAARGERIELSKKYQQQREDEILAEEGPEGVAAYRAMRDMLEKGMKEYLAEMAGYKARGDLAPLNLPAKPVLDPKRAAEILRHGKAIKSLERDITGAVKNDKPIDERIFGKGYYVETRASDAAIEKDLQNELAEQRTRSFLAEVDASDADLGYDNDTRRKTLDRYLSDGTYNAINAASLTVAKQGLLSRDVVEVLGATGAAQVLARAIHQSQGRDQVKDIAEGTAAYHYKTHMEASKEAVRTARDLYEQAHEIELGAAANPAELATMQQINMQRREKLEQAREVLGRTLGEMESNAALVMALRSKPISKLDVTLGPIAGEAAIRQCRAIGLDRDDYEISYDGTNRFLHINESGLGKLVKPIDPEELRVANEVDAIKSGSRDEDNWHPAGTISRPATSFTDPNLQAESIGYQQRQERPLNQWGETGDIRADVEDHIAARIADGEDPNDVLPSVLSNLRQVPEQHRVGVVEALDDLMPAEVPVLDGEGKPTFRSDKGTGKPMLDEAGNPVPATKRVKADYHTERLQALAEKYVTKRFGTRPEVAAFHAQGLKMNTPEDAQRTADAIHRAVGEDPRTCAAFKDPGDLTYDDQAAIRSYFASTVGKPGGTDGVNTGPAASAMADLGPEPERETGGLFGKQTNPAWVEWNNRRKEIAAQQTAPEPPKWNDYVEMMGGTRAAYQSLQDRMKHDFLNRFRVHYSAIHGEPIRMGKRSIANAERHVSFVDPAERERLRDEERKMLDSLRSRVQGKYATGSVKERVNRILQQEEIERQNQMSLLGDAPPKADKFGPGERLSIGMRAENQVKSLMDNVGQNLGQRAETPVKTFPNFNMSGEYAPQQRAVKMFLAAKRMNAALGTGSGKTPISIGSFTAAASDPSTGVKRGIWAVPSSIQGQFHGEIAQFVNPGQFNWHANPGASLEERMTAHRDPNTHMVVMTHQGLRDDLLRMVGDHWGTDPEATAKRFESLPRAERAKEMRAAWDKAGVDYQAAFIDEGHTLLDRKGKPDSLMSAVLQAATDNTSHYMSMSADPAKNDISEIRSQLDKMYPDGRYSDEAAWHKRYGINTSAAREALQREVRSRFIMGHVQPPITATRKETRAQLHPEQAKAYGRILDTFNKARADRAKGVINVDAIKELSPGAFEGHPKSEHEAIARRLSDSIGIIKESALNRVINIAPADKNGKVTALLDTLKTHPVKDKPVIVFAHNLETVHMLEEALQKAGHRAVAFTGEHTGAERDKRRMMFQPPKGKDPQADILILSDAGATGLNLQRGQRLIQYDTPMTAMLHAQRNGRIHRLGQKQDVDLEDLVTDTPYEQKARQRMHRKYDLRNIFTDPGDRLDDTGLAGFISRARQERLNAPKTSGDTPPAAPRGDTPQRRAA